MDLIIIYSSSIFMITFTVAINFIHIKMVVVKTLLLTFIATGIICWEVGLDFERQYISALTILLRKHNFEEIVIIRDKQLSGELVEGIVKMDLMVPRTIIYKWDQELQYSTNTKFIILISNFRGLFRIISFGTVFVLITQIPLLKREKLEANRNSLVFLNGSLYKYELCGKDKFILLQVSDLGKTNFLDGKGCKHVLNEYVSENYDKRHFFPLLVSSSSYSETGVLSYFNKYFIDFLNRKHHSTDFFTKQISLTSAVYSIPVPVRANPIAAYPLFMEGKMCIVVPSFRLVAENIIFHPFERSTWFLISFTLLYFSSMTTLFMREPFFIGIQRSLSFITWTSLYPAYKNGKLGHISLFSIMCAFGFVLSNLYQAKISTFLTTHIYGKEIKTVDDIMKSKLTVLGFDIYNQQLKAGLHPVIKTVGSFDDAFNNAFKFNANYGYSLYNWQWDFLRKSQELLPRKILVYTDICDQEFDPYVSMSTPFQFEDDLNCFTLMVKEAGLMQIWETLTYIDLRNMKLFKYLRDLEDIRKPLTMVYFLHAWYILGCGWCSAIASWILENIFRKLKGDRFFSRLVKSCFFNHFVICKNRKPIKPGKVV